MHNYNDNKTNNKNSDNINGSRSKLVKRYKYNNLLSLNHFFLSPYIHYIIFFMIK